jgi:hypothetical protein
MSAENTIRTGHALPGPGMPFSAPSYDYSTLLGQIAILKPCGENISFDAGLPRSGVLTQQLSLGDWGDDWLLMTFHEPLSYDRAHLPYCLVRARWNGCPVGSEFCPVFVLTDDQGAIEQKDHWVSSDFQFVSWAEIEIAAQPGGQADSAKARSRLPLR